MKALTLLAGIACIFLAYANTAHAAPAVNRSLFVWNTTDIRNDPAAQDQFFRFIDAPFGASDHRIKTLFFDGVRSTEFGDTGTTGPLRRFLHAAHARGVRVVYLCGDPSWATPEHQADALDLLKAILEFNAAGKAGERYDGIAYDVEPYSLPGWPSQDLENGYLSLFDKSNEAIRASGQRLSMSAIIPRWFSNSELDGLDRKVVDRSDAIIIMDYVNSASRLVNDAGKEIAYAATAHKPVWVAVETGELDDTPRATFYGQSNSQMESALTQALPAFQSQASFVGYAIHSLHSYQPMKP